MMIYYIMAHYLGSYFLLFLLYFLQSALDLFNEMEKNTLLSSSGLDILHDTLMEMDQELVSIVNRYREGIKPSPTQVNYTSMLLVGFQLDDVSICLSEIGQRQGIPLAPPRMVDQVCMCCLFLCLTCYQTKPLFHRQRPSSTRPPALVSRGSLPQPGREFDLLVYDNLSSSHSAGRVLPHHSWFVCARWWRNCVPRCGGRAST